MEFKDFNYQKRHRKFAVDVHLEECLNNTDIVLIFQRKTLIGAFQGGGVNFMENICEKHKYLAIRRLFNGNHINEEVAEVLLKKYCWDFYKRL